jgi:hypothetical protein
MQRLTGVFLILILLAWNTSLLAQQPAQTCKDIPTRCDKELLLLRGEVDNKRQAIAVLLDANEQLQTRADKAEAHLKELEKPQAPAPPDTATPLPTQPKD